MQFFLAPHGLLRIYGCIQINSSSLVFAFAQTRGLDAASILSCDGNLHGAQKGEQKDDSEQTGEQDPLIIEAIEKTILASANAIDHIYEK